MKKPGRPRLDATDSTVPVSTKMPARQFDALWQRAQAARISVAEQVRRDVRIAEQLRAVAAKRIPK